MRKVFLGFWLILLGLALLWLASLLSSGQSLTDLFSAKPMMQYTGYMAISLMAFVMILSLRLARVDNLLGGLDRSYRLHKWLAVASLLFSVIHYFWKDIAGLLAEFSVYAQQHNSHEGAVRIHDPSRELAVQAGEVGFYVISLLIVIALTSFVPYHWFKRVHKIISLVFVALLFHSVKLFNDAYWGSLVGFLFGALMLFSLFAALFALFGRIGKGRRAKGKIIGLTPYDEVGVIEATIEIDKKWKGHKAGQFAFLMTNPKEGAHPYTIASEWRADSNQLTFIIKALGDWTRQLRDWMKLDMPVTVEGPYGNFDFDDSCSHQIWVATGIGVTPFIAKMKERAESKPTNKVDFFLAVPVENAEIQRRLEQRALDANVALHWYISSKEERLTAEDVFNKVDDIANTSVWFCGATLLGNSLHNFLTGKGLSRKRFHQELFEFR